VDDRQLDTRKIVCPHPATEIPLMGSNRVLVDRLRAPATVFTGGSFHRLWIAMVTVADGGGRRSRRSRL